MYLRDNYIILYSVICHIYSIYVVSTYNLLYSYRTKFIFHCLYKTILFDSFIHLIVKPSLVVSIEAYPMGTRARRLRHRKIEITICSALASPQRRQSHCMTHTRKRNYGKCDCKLHPYSNYLYNN